VHEDVTPDRIMEIAAECFDGDVLNLGLCIFCGFDEFTEPDSVAAKCSMCGHEGVYGLAELHCRLRRFDAVVCERLIKEMR